MADFDWNSLPEAKQGGAFNWDDHPVVEHAPEKPWYDVSKEGLARGAIDAIPAVGAIGGGILGTAAGPVGSVGGAGLGYAGGKELADFIKNRLLGDAATSTDPIEQAKRVGGNLVDGAAMEMGGQVVGKGLEAAAPYIKPVTDYVGDTVGGAGKSLYKSGLKRIDQVVARYGKEPVSDLLMEHGITGNADQIYKQMDALGERLLSERNDILRNATRGGAEVDVGDSMKEAQDYVNRLKNVDNPEARGAVQMLQGRINEYLGSAAKEPQDFLRSLPTSKLEGAYREIKGFRPASDELIDLPSPKISNEPNFQSEVEGYDAPTLSNPGHGSDSWSGTDLLQTAANGNLKKVPNEPVLRNAMDHVVSFPQGAQYENKFIPGKETGLVQNPAEVLYGREVPAQYIPGPEQTVIDTTDRIAGPSPLQTSSWKTRSANKVGDQAWQQIAQSSEGQGFDKALSSGLRRGTEESVGNTLGQDAADTLASKNSDLGKILTSKERALADAEIEGRKNSFTSIDGILSTNPLILATKKIADLAKGTGFRTSGGKTIVDIANALKRSPQMAELAAKNPSVFNALAQKMEGAIGKGADGALSSAAPKAADQKKPGYDQQAIIQKTQGSKYAQPLQNAAQRGEQAFGATHFILQSQDPDYRKLTLGDDEQAGEESDGNE